jgi:hypothetical protein
MYQIWQAGVKRMSNRFKFINVLVTASVLAVYFLPALMRPDVYSNDAAQHISWMYRFADTNLFANCPLREYFLDTFAPFGFRWLYAILARLIDVQIASELLPFPLAILTMLGAYSLGRGVTSGNEIGGVAGAATVLFGGLAGLEFNFMSPIAGGLQRSFVLPILVYGAVGITQRRFLLMGAMLVAGALFYPPVCIVLGLFIVLVLTPDYLKRRVTLKKVACLGFCAVIAIGILLKMQAQSSAYGPLLMLTEALNMPDFYPGGVFYTPIFFVNKIDYLVNAFPMGLPAVAVWTAAVTTSALFLRRAIRREAWLILLSGFLLYGLSYMFLFRLYDPGRYTMYGLLLFHLMVVPTVCVAIEKRVGQQFGQSGIKRHLARMAHHQGLLAVFVVTIVLAASSLVGYRYQRRQGGMSGDIPDSVYKYLSTLPVDTCIAAHPADANYVPLRSQRCVVLVWDSLSVRQRDFRRKVFEQLGDLLSLMYARDKDEVRLLRGRVNSHIFLVNERRYTDDYLAVVKPTDAVLADLRQRAAPDSRILLHPPARAILFRDGPVAVVDLDRLDE